MIRNALCRSDGVVLARKPAEYLLPADPELSELDRFRLVGVSLSWGELAEGTVRHRYFAAGIRPSTRRVAHLPGAPFWEDVFQQPGGISRSAAIVKLAERWKYAVWL